MAKKIEEGNLILAGTQLKSSSSGNSLPTLGLPAASSMSSSFLKPKALQEDLDEGIIALYYKVTSSFRCIDEVVLNVNSCLFSEIKLHPDYLQLLLLLLQLSMQVLLHQV